jgi:23S rRNA pseudouridine2605 synthase
MAPPKKGLKALDEFFPTGPERIQKLLARAGFGSRRKCEDIISAGRVRIDGEIITELGAKACPKTQSIEVDGNLVTPEDGVYYLLNKPKGVLCTVDDPLGRKTVMSFFPEETRRIFPVGRLDLDSKGAVILTNDGRLTQLLTHPRYGVERTYTARVRGLVDDYSLNQLRSGIQLSEGRTSPAKVWIAKRRDDETELGVTIHEGRNRQVRRMFAAVNHKVRALTRTRIGCLTVKGLSNGEARRLTAKEIRELIQMAKDNQSASPVKAQRRGPKPKRHGKPDPKIAHEQHKEREARQQRFVDQIGGTKVEDEQPSFDSKPDTSNPYELRRRQNESPRSSDDSEKVPSSSPYANARPRSNSSRGRSNDRARSSAGQSGAGNRSNFGSRSNAGGRNDSGGRSRPAGRGSSSEDTRGGSAGGRSNSRGGAASRRRGRPDGGHRSDHGGNDSSQGRRNRGRPSGEKNAGQSRPARRGNRR